MNYAVMYDFVSGPELGAVQGALQPDRERGAGLHLQGHGIVTPNSDTPYSIAVARPPGRADRALRAGGRPKPRYYSVMLCDGNTFNYGYIGSRATGNEPGDYLVAGPDWKGETPPGIKKVFRVRHQFSLAIFRTQLFNPADMENVKKIQAGYKVQPLSAYLKQPPPPAAPAIDFPKIDEELVKTEVLRVPRLRPAVRAAGPGGEGDPREAGQIGIGAGQDLRLQGPLARAQGGGRCWA